MLSLDPLARRAQSALNATQQTDSSCPAGAMSAITIGLVLSKGKARWRGVRQFRFLALLARLSLKSNDSTVTVTVRRVSADII